ncbi:nitroreductase family protein [Phenylobacterium sp.]|uniref:Acg family FMN-binding oxidoreductase n=1 Tax=Phenylobacterium sp. TaxID=1871053 RepID=UPI0035B3E47E
MVGRREVLIGGGAAALLGGGAYLGVRDYGSMAAYDQAVARIRAAMSARPDTRELVRYATLAPNGHNTQPWRFRPEAGHIDILPDLSRRTPVVDPDDHHLFVSLGCAAETLAIAAAARGRGGEVSFQADDGGGVRFTSGNGRAGQTALFDAIVRRQSTRADYDGRPLAAGDVRRLAQAAATPGVDIVFITDRPQLDRLGELVAAGNSAQIADPAFRRELRSWLRFSPRHAMETADGLFSASSGNPTAPEWLGPTMFDLFFKAETENERYRRQIRSSAGVVVFVAEQADPEHWTLAGRACQRFALQATAMGLKQAFINQPVEVAALRPELAKLVGLPGRRPDIVMRFGYGPQTPYSARRPPEAVIV